MQKTQLKWTSNEENLSGIHRLLHTTRAEGTAFQVHVEHSGTFPKRDHVLGKKANLNRSKRIGMSEVCFLTTKELKLETKNKSYLK